MKNERALPDIRKEVGNVLDHWEQLSNDIRSDPGFSALDHALRLLYIAVFPVSPTSQSLKDGQKEPQ